MWDGAHLCPRAEPVSCDGARVATAPPCGGAAPSLGPSWCTPIPSQRLVLNELLLSSDEEWEVRGPPPRHHHGNSRGQNQGQQTDATFTEHGLLVPADKRTWGL